MWFIIWAFYFMGLLLNFIKRKVELTNKHEYYIYEYVLHSVFLFRI